MRERFNTQRRKRWCKDRGRDESDETTRGWKRLVRDLPLEPSEEVGPYLYMFATCHWRKGLWLWRNKSVSFDWRLRTWWPCGCWRAVWGSLSPVHAMYPRLCSGGFSLPSLYYLMLVLFILVFVPFVVTVL